MKKEMKMWCLCRKKDGKPIKLDVVDSSDGSLLNIIGLTTEEDLMLAAHDVEEDEEVREIIFKY